MIEFDANVANLLNYDYEIAAVAKVSGANIPMEMIIEQGRSMMGAFINIQYPYLWLYQRILFGKTASLNAVDAINGSDVPVLIIHCTKDEFVAYEGSSIILNKEVFSEDFSILIKEWNIILPGSAK